MEKEFGNTGRSEAKVNKFRIKKGTAANVSGKKTVINILEAAQKVFAQQGYAGMTLRKVAETAGISLGNLLYYFKTKEDLFRSLADHTESYYRAPILGILQSENDDPDAAFMSYIDFVLDDCKKKTTQNMSYQMWACSISNTFAKTYRRRNYKVAQEDCVDLIRTVNQSLSTGELQHRAFILCTMVEGLTVMLGNGKNQTYAVRGFEEIFRAQALHLAKM